MSYENARRTQNEKERSRMMENVLLLELGLLKPDRMPDWARKERLEYCEPPVRPEWF